MRALPLFLAALVVQWPILRAGFLYDDFLHLFEINNLGPTTFAPWKQT